MARSTHCGLPNVRLSSFAKCCYGGQFLACASLRQAERTGKAKAAVFVQICSSQLIPDKQKVGRSAGNVILTRRLEQSESYRHFLILFHYHNAGSTLTVLHTRARAEFFPQKRRNDVLKFPVLRPQLSEGERRRGESNALPEVNDWHETDRRTMGHLTDDIFTDHSPFVGAF